MLTENDATVPDALEVYDGLRDSSVFYVGFKDIGLPVRSLKKLAQRIRADGRKAMLEVVATNREGELDSIRAALDMNVDYLLGGCNLEEALAMLQGSPIQYFPFVGRTVGHPTVLEGTMDEIVEDARRIASMPGVHGLDLLAYRFAGAGEPAELLRRVRKAARIPVIAAGSIDGEERVRAVIEAKAWGFTVGSALFRGMFGKDSLQAQINAIFQIDGVMA
ncbi:4-hydroxythreonine-4-phosphate dehydrogenase [Candidimonas nitroreducens]|uniref:4-hydroxythreonine-4-phosphate dehydrogenase n=2 Tax=Candidimonas nitroreducens TaxID=683354 RepID=A0A225MLD7_9BURK|nr:4-hydroxythreonine-4-phosphate dehydrogenase [Candidimonas nitroreducens]